MESKSLVDQSMEVLNSLGEYQPPQWVIPVSEKVYEKINSSSSNKVLLVANEGGVMERLSALIEEQTDIQLKILTKMNTCSDAVDNVVPVPCGPANNLGGKIQFHKSELNQLVEHMVKGTTQMVAKTIYNFRHKSKEQIKNILLHEEQQFPKDNPDYQYDNYRYEDGKFGERTIMLIFKRK